MRSFSRHSHFYDLLDALKEPGCAICTIVSRTRWRYLDSLAYENVNDPGVRLKLREALGFCNRHAWYFVDTVREVFGAAIIYRDVLHSVLRLAADPSRLARALVEPDGVCPACIAERDSARHALHTLAEAINEPDVRAAFDASDGLCAPHLSEAMAIGQLDARRAILAKPGDRRDLDLDDLNRLRSRAAGHQGTFGADTLTLDRRHTLGTENGSLEPTDPAEPFVCSVCTAVHHTLSAKTSWLALDDGIGGLCNVHAWMLQGLDGTVLFRRQIAATYAQTLVDPPNPPFLQQAIHGLGHLHTHGENAISLPPCVVCTEQNVIESQLCAISDGPLCLPHLHRAIIARGPNVVAAIGPTWTQLDQLLTEYLRKQDYRFRSEPRGIEDRSPRWTVALISGRPGMR